MLGLAYYGFFLTLLAGLMRLASIRDQRERAHAAAAMLSARVN